MILEVVSSSGVLPEYKTIDSAGMDLESRENIVLKPLGRALISTGLKIAIPRGHEGQVRPRSGLSWNQGITVLNAPGTIDSDYRGEVKVMLINLSNFDYEIKEGERIAQLVIAKYEKVDIKGVDSLDTTIRGEGGFGSTGKWGEGWL